MYVSEGLRQRRKRIGHRAVSVSKGGKATASGPAKDDDERGRERKVKGGGFEFRRRGEKWWC